MKYVVIILLITILMLAGVEGHCQTPVFSQYYASALYLNPALAGLEKDTYLGMNYRSQWSNLSLPFSTFQLSFIQPITRAGVHKKHLGGIGLSFYNDIAGANKEFVTEGVSVSAAYNAHLNRHGNNIVAFAMQTGVSQQKINFDGLRWSSQYSSISGFDSAIPGESGLTNYQVFQPTLNAGIMWYYTNKQKTMSNYSTSVYNGVSFSNILKPSSYFPKTQENTSFLLKVHGGLISTWSRRIELSPNYLVEWQDKNLQINVGMYAGYSLNSIRTSSKTGNTKLLFGLWYRLQDAFIISTGLSNDLWNMGFSYDSNVFAMSKTFGYGSSYELSLAYKIINKNGFKRFSSPLI